jgi:hypothetical protein
LARQPRLIDEGGGGCPSASFVEIGIEAKRRADSAEAGQESFDTQSTNRLPGESRGPSLPPHEPVIAGKVLQLLEKSEAMEPWVPAFAGNMIGEVADFHLDWGFLLSPAAHSAICRIRVPFRRVTLR